MNSAQEFQRNMFGICMTAYAELYFEKWGDEGKPIRHHLPHLGLISDYRRRLPFMFAVLNPFSERATSIC